MVGIKEGVVEAIEESPLLCSGTGFYHRQVGAEECSSTGKRAELSFEDEESGLRG